MPREEPTRKPNKLQQLQLEMEMEREIKMVYSKLKINSERLDTDIKVR